MDILKKMTEEWKKELIEAGEIDPKEELSKQEIQQKYQSYQIKKMKSLMGDMGKSLGVNLPEEKEKKVKSKPEPREPKEKKIIGGPKRANFSTLLIELQDLKKSLEVKFLTYTELFNALCYSLSPELAELINDKSKNDFERKMKNIHEIVMKQVNVSEYGFVAPADLENKINDYLVYNDELNKELNLIYTQMSEKSELMVKSISEMEGE